MPTAPCACRAATTAASWCTRRCPSAPTAGAGRPNRPRSRAAARSSASRSTPTAGCPDFDPPYVIANVALAEDPRVHLTTNIVGCEPSDVDDRPGGHGPLRPTRGRLAPPVRADGRGRPGRPGRRTDAASPPRPPQRRALRAPGRPQRHRPLHLRPTPHGRPALPGRRRQPGGDRRRRADDRRHRRPVDLPGDERRGHERGRRQRHRRGPADPPDMDQRRRRPSGPGGSVIAAAMAVASGLCRHVLCFRTVWESTFAALAAQAPGRRAEAATAPSGCRARSGNGVRPSAPCPPPTGSA